MAVHEGENISLTASLVASFAKAMLFPKCGGEGIVHLRPITLEPLVVKNEIANFLLSNEDVESTIRSMQLNWKVRYSTDRRKEQLCFCSR